jgi:hypothetical protein
VKLPGAVDLLTESQPMLFQLEGQLVAQVLYLSLQKVCTAHSSYQKYADFPLEWHGQRNLDLWISTRASKV